MLFVIRFNPELSLIDFTLSNSGLTVCIVADS